MRERRSDHTNEELEKKVREKEEANAKIEGCEEKEKGIDK